MQFGIVYVKVRSAKSIARYTLCVVLKGVYELMLVCYNLMSNRSLKYTVNSSENFIYIIYYTLLV